MEGIRAGKYSRMEKRGNSVKKCIRRYDTVNPNGPKKAIEWKQRLPGRSGKE